MSEVKLIYVNADADFEEVDPNVDTTTFGGLTITDGTGSLVIDPDAGPGGTTPEINMGGGEITNLATPDGTDSTAAATVGYVTQSLDGLDVKNSVNAASTANINLTAGSSPDTVDGVNVKTVGARILVKNSTLARDNGIYEVSAVGAGTDDNTWIRATDADTIAKLNANAFTFVEAGTVNEDTGWVVTSSPSTLGTDDIDWTQFSKKGVNTASLGVEIVSNDIRLDLIGGSGGSGGLVIVSDEVGINFATSPFNQANRPIAANILASTSGGEGASVIGIQDSGTHYTSTDVEGALQEIGSDLAALASSSFSMTAGVAITKGDLLYMTANDTVQPMPINALHRPIGVATETVSSAASVGVVDHGLLTSVVTGATFGTQYYWSGTAWTTTVPSTSGNYVWKLGVAANATDVVVMPSFVKRNS